MLHEPENPNNLEEEQYSEPSQPTKKRSVFFILLICLLFFFGGALLTRAIFNDQTGDDVNAYDPITLQPKKPQGFFHKIKNLVSPPKQVLGGENEDRINVLLLGQGGPGHDGPYLTDTIILASIDTKTKKVAFISIPRDLMVQIPGLGYRKINNANSVGEVKQRGLGPALATNVIQQTFDINIPYYILVDFTAAEALVDAVGGVDITVEKAFTDYQYPIPGKEDVLPESNRYKVLSFKTGLQHMDGTKALEFTRSRHGNNGEGSDYARSKRQQKVILAMKQKVLSAGTLFNPLRINEILNSLQTHITTNLQFSDIIAFMKLGRELDTENIISLTLDDSPTGFLKQGYSADGAFILEPKTGNFNQIQTAIDNVFTATTTPLAMKNQVAPTTLPKPEEIQDHTQKTLATSTPVLPQFMKIEVKNGTWREGLAARVKSQLEERNLTVTSLGNTVQRPRSKSGIYILTNTPLSDTVQVLKTELHLPVISGPSGENTASSTDILVILGEDFKQ